MSLREAFKDAIRKRVFVKSTPLHRVISTVGGTPHEQQWIFDFRAIMLEPTWLDAYATLFWEAHASKMPFQVGGMETAAIALVAAIVMKGVERGTPVNGFYIRKSRKREGLMKQIEGTLNDEPIILVDDIINSGSSIKKQLLLLEAIGKKVAEVATILSFEPADSYRLTSDDTVRVSSFFVLDMFGAKTSPLRTADLLNDAYTQVWKFTPGDPGFEHVVQKSAPVLDEHNVYYGTDRGTFFAISQATGQVVWSFEIGKHPDHKGIFSTPALHHGVVYFGAYDGTVYALDAQTGHVVWKNDYADWVGSSPAVSANDRTLYIGLEFGLFRKHGGMCAIDLGNGKTRWTDRTSALTHGSPLHIAHEHLVIIGSNDGIAYAYTTHGEKQWAFQTGGDIKTRPAYDATTRLAYVPSMDSKLYALHIRDGTPAWAFETKGPLYCNPLVYENTVYIASLDKSVYAINASTGTLRWEFATSGRIFSSPVFAEKSIWIGSNDGILYELDTHDGTLRTTHQFTERIVNAIAYNETTGHFFVTTVANELYCLKRATTT